MPITSIKMINVKGVSNANQPLTGRDIIVGANGSGKSTRLDSMACAIQGFFPGKGKTNDSIMEYATDSTMQVGITADSFGVSRTWKKTNGKVSQTIEVKPPKGERTSASKEARIESVFGDTEVIFNFQAFLDMTDKKKREYIFDLAAKCKTKATRWTAEKIIAKLKSLVNANIYDIPDLCTTALDTLADEISMYDEPFLALNVACEYATAQKAYFKKELAKLNSTFESMSDYKSDSNISMQDYESNKKALQNKIAEKENLIAEIAKTRNESVSKMEKNQRLEEILSLLDDLEAQSQNGDNDNRIYIAKKEQQEELEQLFALISKNNAKYGEYEKQIKQLNREISDIITQIEKFMFDRSKAEADWKEQNAKCRQLFQQLIERKSGKCPLDPNIHCTTDLGDILTKLNDTFLLADQKRKEIEKHGKAKREQIDNLTTLRTAKQKELAEVTQSQIDVYNDSEKLREQQSVIEQKLRSYTSTNADTQKEALQAEYDRISDNGEYWDTDDSADMLYELDVLNQDISALQEQTKQQERILTSMEIMAKQRKESAESEINLSVWSNLADQLGAKGTIQSEIAKSMYGSLADGVNEKLHALGFGDNAQLYIDTVAEGKEVCRIGIDYAKSDWDYNEENGLIVTESTAGKRLITSHSKGEQLLITLAILITIIELTSSQYKILAVDNANDLDDHNFNIMLSALNTIGQKMDNIIIAGVMPVDDDTAEQYGWTVHRI
jgi:exonuclease SbcC